MLSNSVEQRCVEMLNLFSQGLNEYANQKKV